MDYGGRLETMKQAHVVENRKIGKTASLWWFTQNLALLMDSGLQLVPSLDVLSECPEDPIFGVLVEDLSKKVSVGNTLSSALSAYAGTFPTTYVKLVESGEQTGSLVLGLRRLARWCGKEMDTRRRLVKALAYPLLVLTVTLVLTALLMLVLVPRVLESSPDPSKLPLFSRGLLWVSELAKNPGALLIATAVVVYLGAAYQHVKNRPETAALLHSVPLLGRVIKATVFQRFCQALSMLVEQGVELRLALSLATEASGDALVREDCARLIKEVEGGSSLTDALEFDRSLYPTVLTAMVRVGEETAYLAKALDKCGDLFEQEAEQVTDTLLVALEPIVVGLLSLVVGVILVGVFGGLYAQLEQL